MKLVALLTLCLLLSPVNATMKFTTNLDIQIPKDNSTHTLSLQTKNQLQMDNRPILQSFFWMTPKFGDWYSMLEEKLPEFAEAGFGGIWAPPPQKSRVGEIGSGGYEPYDYFDLGEFFQQGRVETRYGSRAELESMISRANQMDIAVIADIVINHNNGGDPEFNNFTNSMTNTNFENIASGRFPRNYTHFHPCEFAQKDAEQFANFPDLCHAHPYVHDNLIKWGQWLRDEIGFDGWRFDVAHGVIPKMIHDWMVEVGGYGVTEHLVWPERVIDDTISYMQSTNFTHTSFDFYLTYALRNMILGNGNYDMRNLGKVGLLHHVGPGNTSTFVVNHDTVRDDIEGTFIPYHRELGYSYILMHEGFPYVYWDDYFDEDLQRHLKGLIQIREKYAVGGSNVLHADDDLYIMERTGEPGLVFGLNDNPTQSKTITIQTKFIGTELNEMMGKMNDVSTNGSGFFDIRVPPRDFVIYAPGQSIQALFDLVIPDREFPSRWKTPDTVPFVERPIIIDGILDDHWPNPLYLGEQFEQIGNQKSLLSSYVANDAEYLYIGINTGRTGYLPNMIDYGIAFDTSKGGANNGPGIHSNLRFSLNNEPEYLLYLFSDNSTIWNEVTSGQFFIFKEGWSEAMNLDPMTFAMDNILGFIEAKIPLENLDIKQNGEIGIKIFTTSKENPNIERTLPFDDTLKASDGNSWLNFPLKLILSTNTTISGKRETINDFLKFGDLSSFLIIFPLFLIIRLVMRKKFKQPR